MAKPASNKLKSKEKSAPSIAVAASGERAPGDVPPEPKGQHRWVYAFGGGKAEGRSDMRNLLGGKGAGLAEMANLGLPVPPGFTITTEVCTHYYANGNAYPKELAGRSSGRWPRWGASLARRSVTRAIPFSCRCARGRAPQCPA